jgi:hypothetical protein
MKFCEYGHRSRIHNPTLFYLTNGPIQQVLRWRHDTQHNDIQHKNKYITTLSIMALCIDYCFAERHFF